MFDWLRELNGNERKTLTAAFAGWSVDAFDVMVYSFAIPTLLTAWQMSKEEAGLIATASLITSAIGGWAAGILADRFGRVKVLQATILWFAIFTFLSGFTSAPWQLMITRALQGLGFGGEWAVGSVLVAEMIRSQHRGKAVGTVQSGWAVGWGAATVVYALVFGLLPEEWAWRSLFWAGILPAVLVVYIRRNVAEPEIYLATRTRTGRDAHHFLEIFSPSLLSTTILASLLSAGLMATYYAVTTWVPTYLKTVRHLSVIGTGWYTFVIVVGSFVGFVTSAYLNDFIGRRRTFLLFGVSTGVLAVAYTLIPISDAMMLFLSFPLGFFLCGNFSGFGAFLTELFPSRMRGSGQGFVYNFGRGLGAFAPPLVGHLSKTIPLGDAIGIVSGASVIVAVLMLAFLPETRGKQLAVYD